MAHEHSNAAESEEEILRISERLQLPIAEIELSAVRAQGAGGQHVNKTSSAIHLRFDIAASSLPDHCKEALLKLGDQRVSSRGVVVIKAQQHRSQPQNRDAALGRLAELIKKAANKPKPRVARRVSRAAKNRRVDHKTVRGQLKKLRSRLDDLD